MILLTEQIQAFLFLALRRPQVSILALASDKESGCILVNHFSLYLATNKYSKSSEPMTLPLMSSLVNGHMIMKKPYLRWSSIQAQDSRETNNSSPKLSTGDPSIFRS